MTAPTTSMPAPCLFDLLPDDALLPIMDRIDHPSPGLASTVKGGALPTFALSSKRMYQIFQETLQAKNPEGSPLPRGIAWERNMAKSFLKRGGDFKTLAPWLQSDPLTVIEAIRNGQLPWEKWETLDFSLKTDPEFVLNQLFFERLSIRDLSVRSSQAELMALFGLKEGEKISPKKLQGMPLSQFKVAILYSIDQVQAVYEQNEQMNTIRLRSFFSVLFSRPDLDFTREFFKILWSISPELADFFPYKEDVLKNIVSVFPRFYQQLNKSWIRTPSIALAAIRHNHNYLLDVGSSHLNDENFLLDAIQANKLSIIHIDIKKRNDFNFMLNACQVNDFCLRYIGMELEKNRLFLDTVDQWITKPEMRTKLGNKKSRC
jgi:hypothetical protein